MKKLCASCGVRPDDLDMVSCGDSRIWHKHDCPLYVRECAVYDLTDFGPKLEAYIAAGGVLHDATYENMAQWRRMIMNKVGPETPAGRHQRLVAEEIERLVASGEAEKMKCLRCGEIEAESQQELDVPELPDVTGRHGVAHEFATWLEAQKLQPAREALVERDSSKRHYRVCWSTPDAEIGGEVRIFGPEWIQVTWDGDVEFMPMKGNRVFDSDFTARSFLTSAFIKRDWEAAQNVPVRAEKK